MSLSTCEHCGGNIPLGPEASNVCDECGNGVFSFTNTGATIYDLRTKLQAAENARDEWIRTATAQAKEKNTAIRLRLAAESRAEAAEELAYIDEHHFPDSTWKSRCEELVVDMRLLQAEVARTTRTATDAALRWAWNGQTDYINKLELDEWIARGLAALLGEE